VQFAPWMIVVSLLIKTMVYYLFGLYRRVWMYASVREVKLIVTAVTTASGIVSLVMMALVSRHYLFLPRLIRR